MKKSILVGTLLLCAAVFLWVYRTEQRVEQGRQAFARYGCASCHYSGGAPNLQNVGNKYDSEMLSRFLQDPESIYRSRDNRALNGNFRPMPRIKLAPEDIPALVAYLRQLSN